METVTLYIMSFKGFAVLEHIIKSNRKHLIDLVVYSTDKNTKNDYSLEIVQRIEGYLAGKWGLINNLPNNHPYR